MVQSFRADRRRLRLTPYHAEPNILRRRRAIRLRVRGTIRAAADHFSFAIARQHPLSYVAAEIVDRIFVVFALSAEASNFFQKRRTSAELLRFFAEPRRILRIRRIPRPVIERVLTIAMLVQLFHFVFVRNAPDLPSEFRQPLCITFRILYCDGVDGTVSIGRCQTNSLAKLCVLKSSQLEPTE